tara:strand:- start:102 stop:602 length:501 start_codon:yes stop_codon:yes gene_type:complete
MTSVAVALVDYVGTLNNLNKTGGGLSYSGSIDSAIPIDTTGLYELINTAISELSSMKASIKTNEKKLISNISTDTDDTSILITNAADISVASVQGNSSVYAGVNARGTVTSTTASSKPAVIINASGVGYTEDALFSLLRSFTYDIMTVNNATTAGATGQQGSALVV